MEFFILFSTFGLSTSQQLEVISVEKKKLSKLYHPAVHCRPPLSGGQRGAGGIVHACRQWVLHYSKLVCSEIMRKAQAHRPAASHAVGGGVFGL